MDMVDVWEFHKLEEVCHSLWLHHFNLSMNTEKRPVWLPGAYAQWSLWLAPGGLHQLFHSSLQCLSNLWIVDILQDYVWYTTDAERGHNCIWKQN